MEYAVPIAVALALVILILVILVVVIALNGRRGDQSIALLQNQVNALAAQVTASMDASRRSMDERLDNAARVIRDVSTNLGQMQAASQKIFDLGKDISDLQKVLQAPKLRGNLGELFLDDLLSQILPSNHYQTQYAFRSGETVDAVVLLKSGMVPVDAKFPLENFRRVVDAASDDERKAAKREFVRDVKKHVDAIASKYIRPDENTFDFALMYIPAENVYYEAIVKDDQFSANMALFSYSLARRVIPVSPNSFYAYLQTILLGLKGMRVEESTREMLNQLAALQKEFERFRDAFRLVGTQLANSSRNYQDAEKHLGKMEGKMEQIGGLTRGSEAIGAEAPAIAPEP